MQTPQSRVASMTVVGHELRERKDEVSWSEDRLAGTTLLLASCLEHRGYVGMIASRFDTQWQWMLLDSFRGIERTKEEAIAAVEREFKKVASRIKVWVPLDRSPDRL